MSDQKVKLKRRAKITVRWEVVTKLVMVDGEGGFAGGCDGEVGDKVDGER